MFGVRSLLEVEKVLTNDLAMQPAISHQYRLFFSRHSQALSQLG